MAGFEGGYPVGSLLWIVNNIYFQYYSLFIFVVSAVVLIAVSYVTAPPPERQLAGLTYATVNDEQRRQTRGSWNRWDVLSSCTVLAMILIAYLYFNG